MYFGPEEENMSRQTAPIDYCMHIKKTQGLIFSCHWLVYLDTLDQLNFKILIEHVYLPLQ
jgi:hypothetical protein